MATSSSRTTARRVAVNDSLPACSEPKAGLSPIREGSPQKLDLLIQSWLKDSSGLDDKIWPLLEQDLADTTRDCAAGYATWLR